MRNLLLLSALCIGVSGVGHADTVFTLVNNTYENSGVATGTLNIDTVKGAVDSVNINYQMGGTDLSFTGAPSSQGTFDNNTQYVEYTFDVGGDSLLLDLPVSSLVGYAGGTLCTVATQCDGYAGNLLLADGVTLYNALTGSLETTPEPSSLILLGTGMLATFGAARRRLLS